MHSIDIGSELQKVLDLSVCMSASKYDDGLLNKYLVTLNTRNGKRDIYMVVDQNMNVTAYSGNSTVLLGSLHNTDQLVDAIRIYFQPYRNTEPRATESATVSSVPGMGPVSFSTDVPVGMGFATQVQVPTRLVSFSDYIKGCCPECGCYSPNGECGCENE